MKLEARNILLTGAGGGIGRELVRSFVAKDANVMLIGRDIATLQRVAARLGVSRERVTAVGCDLARASERARLCEIAADWRGGIDVLVNNAGVADFTLLADQSAGSIDAAIATNLIAPIDLCRRLVPTLARKAEAHIVNIGSVFGSIGFAGNAVYSATKFGLRGFSEALRRELADTNVHVHYFAPRATHTGMNDSVVDELNDALGNVVDEPDVVADQLVRALEHDRLECVLGSPEKFFARINALLPRLVDRALFKQLPIIQRHARRSIATPAACVQGSGEHESRRLG